MAAGKAVTVPAIEAEAPLTTQEIIDELGPLNERLDQVLGPLKPDQQRAEFLEDELKKRVARPTAITLNGTGYCAVVGKRNKATIINYTSVWKWVPGSVLKAIMTAGAEKLRAVVKDPKKLAKMISETQTGPRTVSTYRIPDKAA
jgi:hypothetical protein